jgi:hypothetical protein
MDQVYDNLILFTACRSHGLAVLWIAYIALIYFLTARASLLLLLKPKGITAVWRTSILSLFLHLLIRRDLRQWARTIEGVFLLLTMGLQNFAILEDPRPQTTIFCE